jgi:hypothetical protein
MRLLGRGRDTDASRLHDDLRKIYSCLHLKAPRFDPHRLPGRGRDRDAGRVPNLNSKAWDAALKFGFNGGIRRFAF